MEEVGVWKKYVFKRVPGVEIYTLKYKFVSA